MKDEVRTLDWAEALSEYRPEEAEATSPQSERIGGLSLSGTKHGQMPLPSLGERTMLYGSNRKTFREATREIDEKMAQPGQDASYQLALYAAQRACDATAPDHMAEVATKVYRDVLDGLAKPSTSQDGV